MEQKQVLDDISIMLRQRKGSVMNNQNVTAGLLRQPTELHNLIREDQAFRSLKNTRGSPSYWSNVQHEAMAMIRQLGKPTWFLTLSAADMKWPEVIQAIGTQYGCSFSKEDVEEMTWDEKSTWLSNHPVTAARHFQYRLDTFFQEFLRGKCRPIGEIIDYIICIEFQSRGSPHAHTIIWVKNAPKIGVQTDQEVIDFINKYQMCDLPTNDQELLELVQLLQTHVHSASCRRPLSSCRFHFPLPPTKNTIIAREEEDDTKLKKVKITLSKINEIISEKEFDRNITLDELLRKCAITDQEYVNALSLSQRGNGIVLKRCVNAIFVNNYNPHILKTWKANMDLQYIVDAYACVMYVASYVLKTERTMSDLLKRVSQESANDDVKTQLRKLGAAFLNNREVSAQEAVYRVLSLPLNRTSRKVVFINTSPKDRRVRMLKPMSVLKDMEENDENVFLTGLLGKYVARPDELENISLAEFGAWYTYGGKRQGPDQENSDEEADDEIEKKSIKLKNGLGVLHKRKTAAVIRFPTFRQSHDKNLQYRGKAMLFVPWRCEEKDIDSIDNFEDFVKQNQQIISEKEKMFTALDESIIEESVVRNESGSPEHNWNSLAPLVQHEEQTAEDEGSSTERNVYPEDLQANEDMITNAGGIETRYEIETNKTIMPPEEYREMFMKLNDKQKQAVIFNRRWCRNAVSSIRNGRQPEPYHIFLSGPGGVGKSHVIKLIHNDAIRTFRQSGLFEPDDISVI